MRQHGAAHPARSTRHGLGVVAALVFVFSVTSCSEEQRAAAPAPTRAVEQTYVAVGASETIGRGAHEPLQQAWTQLFFRQSLPIGTVFVNVGISGATVETAIAQQLPEALRLKADVVTVWLNVNDAIDGVPADTYEKQLSALVRALRRGGTATVLVANTPPLERLPAYLACLEVVARRDRQQQQVQLQPQGQQQVQQQQSYCTLSTVSVPPPEQVVAMVAAYNEAIARVVAAEGAVLVDLHGAAARAREEGIADSLVSSDGFHPSSAGHAHVAKAFGAAARATSAPH